MRASDVELVGKKLNRLTVISIIRQTGKRAYCSCICECGNSVVILRQSVVSGTTKSCGCWNTQRRRTHHMSESPEYNTWEGMNRRCTDPSCKAFRRYGGRGITVCDRWKSFENFFSDMGNRPSAKHSLDRIDNDGPYSPENCRWATVDEQAANKGNTVRVSAFGKRLTIKEWALRTGVHPVTIRGRLRSGWEPQKAVSANASWTTRLIAYRGEIRTLTEWSKALDMNRAKLKERLKKTDWCMEGALAKP